ncbi:MaoC family dehydratase [Alteromonas sp. H39]|uniref:MaoC family dehydratase n=1 Tax=Alteromonas sp. H39 TaxID=3389876 RepID=UPI0039DF81C6
MISLYLRALAKRVDKKPLQQFKPPQLPVRIYNKTISINPEHYAGYCELVGWAKEKSFHPCYLQTLSLPLQMACLLDKKSPFPLLGLVHIRNTVTQYPCDKHLPLEFRVRFSGVRQHPRGWECDVNITALQHGQCVYDATSTYLTRVKASHVEPAKVRAAREVRGTTKALEGPVLSVISVPENTGRRYARVSGDYNPIHLSHLTAKAFGFKRAIAHGMWTLARCYAALTENANTDQQPVQLDAEFEKPVFLPASVQLVSDTSHDSDDNHVVGFRLISDDSEHYHIRGQLRRFHIKT